MPRTSGSGSAPNRDPGNYHRRALSEEGPAVNCEDLSCSAYQLMQPGVPPCGGRPKLRPRLSPSRPGKPGVRPSFWSGESIAVRGVFFEKTILENSRLIALFLGKQAHRPPPSGLGHPMIIRIHLRVFCAIWG